MTRIKIEDLPKDKKISKEEMKKVFGGAYTLGQVGINIDLYGQKGINIDLTPSGTQSIDFGPSGS